MSANEIHYSPEDWLRRILDIHFHPDLGASYWIEKARLLGIDVQRDIRCLDDLLAFGPMDERALAGRPVEDFIPKKFLSGKKNFVLGDTGGTTGLPKTTAYRSDEFFSVFVEFFGRVAEAQGFPSGCNWLWVGPGGPHIIGKAARMLAVRMGSMEPFTVDFDPRWIKKMVPGSMGWERYFQHIEDQAMRILNIQDIGVIFSTPPVIARLAEKMDDRQRAAIRGVHYGGLPLEVPLYERLKKELFPGAVHISGYGNTLFGVCLEMEPIEGSIHYFYESPRLVLRVVESCRDTEAESTRLQRLEKTVGYGSWGQVVFSRLDESFLILNMFERDTAVRIPASRAARARGLNADGVADPQPPADAGSRKKTMQGLY
jgi:thienamycin biosynthesis protein ThnN